MLCNCRRTASASLSKLPPLVQIHVEAQSRPLSLGGKRRGVRHDHIRAQKRHMVRIRREGWLLADADWGASQAGRSGRNFGLWIHIRSARAPPKSVVDAGRRQLQVKQPIQVFLGEPHEPPLSMRRLETSCPFLHTVLVPGALSDAKSFLASAQVALEVLHGRHRLRCSPFGSLLSIHQRAQQSQVPMASSVEPWHG